MILYVSLVSFFSIICMILANQLWFEPVSKSILNVYASISSFILNIFGQGTNVDDTSIVSSSFSIQVKKGCDALAPMILYIFSVAFFPTDIKSKLKGLLFGLPILAVLNLIRLISLFLIGKYGNQMLFDIFHVDVWQIIFIVLTLVIWSYWLKFFQHKSISAA